MHILNSLRILKNRKRKTLERRREEFNKNFFYSSFHEWILKNKYLSRSFEILFESFDRELLEVFDNKLLFIKTEGKWASALSSLDQFHIILIYPDLRKLLNSPLMVRGVAVMAHEVGHIYLGHPKKNIESHKAQLEADYFACRLGFKKELIDFLSEYPNSWECQTRLENLKQLKQ